MSTMKKRLDVREAKEHLRKAYQRNPNPSDAQLKGIAENVGRSCIALVERAVTTVQDRFEKERSSSNANTPEPTQRSQVQVSIKHSTSNIATNGFAKQPVRPTPLERDQVRPAPTLKSKQQLAPAKQQALQPTQPRPQSAQSKPTAPQKDSSSVAPSPITPSQTIPSQTTTSQAAPQPKEKDISPAGGYLPYDTKTLNPLRSSLDQTAEAGQNVTDNEQSHSFPNVANMPVAYEGVTKLQHELHCAMALYYQATQGLPMSYPESLR
ncbi:hypothetical protein FRC10_011121 [Ceratobasidium sp. 414]|nr:hypothetical protein FRC10_011121 [Ceratobasidium sp. 414]